MPPRRWPVLLAAPLLALLASACSQPLHAGAAATVGGATIPVSELRQVLARTVAYPGATASVPSTAALLRSELSMLIDHQLLLDLAAREHVTVTGQDIDAEQAQLVGQAGGYPQLLAQAAQVGIAPADLRRAVEDAYLRNQIADVLTANLPVAPSQLQALYQQNISQFDQVQAAQIVVASKAEALTLYREARAAPARFGQLARTYSTDTATRAAGGSMGFVGPATLVPALSRVLFTTPPGTIAAPVHTASGWHVVEVIAHRSQPLAAVTTLLREQILAPQRQAALTAALVAEVSRVGVEVSPQFGVWSNGQVNAPTAAQQLASPAPGQPLALGPRAVLGAVAG